MIILNIMKNMPLNQNLDSNKLCKIIVAAADGHGSNTRLNSDTYPPDNPSTIRADPPPTVI